MTPNDEKPNFLDRGTLLAVGLILAVWFGWAKYMEYRYPPAPPVAAVDGQNPTTSAAQPVVSSQPSAQANLNQPSANPSAAAAPGPVVEKTLSYSDDSVSFDISSKGMGLSNVDIKTFKTRKGEPIVLSGAKGDTAFATYLFGSTNPVDFAIEKTASDTFVGRATVDGLLVEKTLRVLSDRYAVDTQVKVTAAAGGSLVGFKGLVTGLSEVAQPLEGGGFMSSAANEHQDWYVGHEGTKTRKTISIKDGLVLSQPNASLVALSSHYFALAAIDHSDILPKFDTTVAPQASVIVGRLNYVPLSQADSFSIKYTAFAGPKSYDLLGSIDPNLQQIIDYGMFGVVGKPILWLLKYLHGIIGNWGWSILALTIIVRLIVLPFNAYSFKSMKAMQRIQPEMNRIKERYKDKPADQKIQMNQEIMQLMKANKASPVGGCLPTLLQLPVFFALYQVLGQSIELYRAPFIFWIQDLSVRDPYFVLPVLMGLTMFAQQKLTPTTMDPQQAKILQWMPIMFAFFMLSVPSGLTFYIFISTLFGICQQYFFMRDKKTAVGRIKEAKA